MTCYKYTYLTKHHTCKPIQSYNTLKLYKSKKRVAPKYYIACGVQLKVDTTLVKPAEDFNGTTNV